MVSQKYRWDFIGLSTDTKPTSETSEKVVNGSTYYCSDTSKLYVYCDGAWYERKPLGGGGASYTAGDGIDITNDVISTTNTGKAKELTAADYNWPTANPDGVALWLLDPGIYVIKSGVLWYSNYNSSFADGCVILKSGEPGSNSSYIISQERNGSTSVRSMYVNVNGQPFSSGNTTLVKANTIVDNLSSTLATVPLSANQGRVLKDLVDSLAIRASGAPTTSTVGVLGQLYTDTTNMHTYQCTAISGGTYTWTQRW